MPVVIEFTLRPIPGHFDAVLATYLEFVEELEEELDELRLVLAAAEPGVGIVRGVAVYDSARVAQDLARLPFFARLGEALEPHLAAPPERVAMDLVGLYLAGDPLRDGLEPASLVELEWRAKLGHLKEMLEVYEPMIERYEEAVPDCHLVLETVNEASGTVRVFLLYDHHEVAQEAAGSPLVAHNIEVLSPLLAAPPSRIELRLAHLFARS